MEALHGARAHIGRWGAGHTHLGHGDAKSCSGTYPMITGRTGRHPRPQASLQHGRPPAVPIMPTAPAPEHPCPRSLTLHPPQLLHQSGPHLGRWMHRRTSRVSVGASELGGQQDDPCACAHRSWYEKVTGRGRREETGREWQGEATHCERGPVKSGPRAAPGPAGSGGWQASRVRAALSGPTSTSLTPSIYCLGG